ncbi:MAG: quinolinate synthase NadA [Bacillota bacterium]
MNKELVSRLEELKEAKNAVILAHNYQIEEVQAVADYTGDSLGLSRQAAETEAEVIVFCGVDFMAESAAILSPEKKVLLPRQDAGCPMAAMITADSLQEKKEEFPEATVVCYVNSSAAVKAKSDICCTSSNAVDIVEAIDNDQILFVPDQNLGQYVAQQTEKEIILWEGFCATHHRVVADDVRQAREDYPQAEIIVHPESRPEVIELADEVGSTAQILDFARDSTAKRVIIGTEEGLTYKLNNQNPTKDFELLSSELVCPNMKLTTLEDVVTALEQMETEVEVDDATRREAKRALDQMLEFSQ